LFKSLQKSITDYISFDDYDAGDVDFIENRLTESRREA
jgi:hypothetical protein